MILMFRQLMNNRGYSNPADPRMREGSANMPTMDPRKAKRPASRSPEGVPHRKQTRPEPPRDSASRRSSISNGTPRHLGLTSPGAYERRPSHVTTDVRSKEANSPSSKSGRSTPMQHTSDVQTLAVAPDIASAVVSEGSRSILDTLMQFSSTSAQYAILQYKKEEAASGFKRIDREYLANEANFTLYPAIRERKTAARDAAQKELTTIELQLKACETQSQHHMQGLSKLIEDAATPKQPPLVKEDFVSVEAFERLMTKYEELKRGKDSVTASTKTIETEVRGVRDRERDIGEKLQNITQAQEKMQRQMTTAEERQKETEGKLQSTTALVKATQIDVKDVKDKKRDTDQRLQSAIHFQEQMEDQVKAAEGRQKETDGKISTMMAWKAETVRPVLEDVDAIKTRLTNIEKQSNDVKDALGVLQASRYSEHAIGRATELASLQAIESRLKEAEVLTNKVQDDIKKLHDSQAQGYASKKDYTELLERQDKFDQDLGGLKKTVSKKGNVSRGSENVNSTGIVLPRQLTEDEFRDTVQKLATEGPELINKVEQLQHGLQAMAEKVDGKENSSSGLMSRLDVIDAKIEKIERRDAGHAIPRPQDRKSPPTDATAPSDIEDLKTDVEQLWTNLLALPEVVNTEVQRIVQGLQDSLSSLKETSTNQEGTLDKIRSDLEGKVNDLRVIVITSFQTKKDSGEELKTLRKEMEDGVDLKLKGINEQMKGLKQQQQTGSPSLPPSNQQPQQQQMPRQSPYVPNGRTPSPLVNGRSAPPSHAHGHHGPMVQAAVPQQQQQMPQQRLPDVQHLHMRIDQVTAVLDQLKRRYDNLTTDEMVKVMLKQFEAVWPYAGKYEATCRGLWTAVHETNRLLSGLQEKVNAVQNAQESSTTSGNNSAAAERVPGAMAALNRLEQMIIESKTLYETHEQLLKEVDIKQMSKELEKVGPALSKHERQDYATSTAIGKMEGNIASVQDRLATLSGQLEAMDEAVSSLM